MNDRLNYYEEDRYDAQGRDHQPEQEHQPGHGPPPCPRPHNAGHNLECIGVTSKRRIRDRKGFGHRRGDNRLCAVLSGFVRYTREERLPNAADLPTLIGTEIARTEQANQRQEYERPPPAWKQPVEGTSVA